MNSFKLNYLHLCDEIIFSQDGKLSLIGIFEVINLVSLPGSLLKAWLVCNLSVAKKIDKVSLDITLRNVATGKETFKVPTLTPSFVQDKKNMDNEQKLGITLQLVNINFQEVGKYVLEVQVNKETVGSVFFNVNLVERKGVN